jgi:hypothetical protein
MTGGQGGGPGIGGGEGGVGVGITCLVDARGADLRDGFDLLGQGGVRQIPGSREEK